MDQRAGANLFLPGPLHASKGSVPAREPIPALRPYFRFLIPQNLQPTFIKQTLRTRNDLLQKKDTPARRATQEKSAKNANAASPEKHWDSSSFESEWDKGDSISRALCRRLLRRAANGVAHCFLAIGRHIYFKEKRLRLNLVFVRFLDHLRAR